MVKIVKIYKIFTINIQLNYLSDNMTMKTGSNLKFNDEYEYLTFDLDQEFLLGELQGFRPRIPIGRTSRRGN